jgi:hypothetical protein
MLIRQAHALQNLVNLPVQPAKPGAKESEAGSFESLLSSHVSTPAPALNYRPVGTIHVSGGGAAVGSTASATGKTSTTPGSTTPVTTPTPSAATPAPPFTAGFQQGVVTGPDGSTTNLNSMELADSATAQEVAAMLGGTVTQDSMAGGYTASASTLEISVPGSSAKVNAGLAANLFANYGTAAGSQAWRIINQDLGRDPMSTGPVS